MPSESTSYGVVADNPAVLVKHLESIVGTGITAGDTIVLQIVLPCCGATKVYRCLDDIPEKNVGPCKCGNWFIYYEERTSGD